MELNEIKKLSFDEVRRIYKNYLMRLDLAQSTVSTAYTDTFYLWKHCGCEVFWSITLSDDFESEAKKTLIEVLSAKSSGDVYSLVNGYVSHLKRFRYFVISDNDYLEGNKEKRVVVKKKARIKDKFVPKPSIEQVEYYLKNGKNWKTILCKKVH